MDEQEQKKITIHKLQKELETIKKIGPKQENKNKEALEKRLEEAEKSIETIKAFLNDIHYKTIESLYNEYTTLEKQSKELDKKIYELEQESKQVDERKLQLQKASIQKESIEKQVHEYTITITEKEQEWKKLT